MEGWEVILVYLPSILLSKGGFDVFCPIQPNGRKDL